MCFLNLLAMIHYRPYSNSNLSKMLTYSVFQNLSIVLWFGPCGISTFYQLIQSFTKWFTILNSSTSLGLQFTNKPGQQFCFFIANVKQYSPLRIRNCTGRLFAILLSKHSSTSLLFLSSTCVRFMFSPTNRNIVTWQYLIFLTTSLGYRFPVYQCKDSYQDARKCYPFYAHRNREKKRLRL